MLHLIALIDSTSLCHQFSAQRGCPVDIHAHPVRARLAVTMVVSICVKVEGRKIMTY